MKKKKTKKTEKIYETKKKKKKNMVLSSSLPNEHGNMIFIGYQLVSSLLFM